MSTQARVSGNVIMDAIYNAGIGERESVVIEFLTSLGKSMKAEQLGTEKPINLIVSKERLAECLATFLSAKNEINIQFIGDNNEFTLEPSHEVASVSKYIGMKIKN